MYAETALANLKSKVPEWQFLEADYRIRDLAVHPRPPDALAAGFTRQGYERWNLYLDPYGLTIRYVVIDKGVHAENPTVLVRDPIGYRP